MGGGRGGDGGRHIVHMRGLPFRVTEQDIAEWFSSVADPIDVMIHYNHDGRPSGEADTMFATEGDARELCRRTSRICSTAILSSSTMDLLSLADTKPVLFHV